MKRNKILLILSVVGLAVAASVYGTRSFRGDPDDRITANSTSPGHAMKVTDYVKAQGAIIGKAMTSLEAGQGLVLVLVTLQ